MGVYGCLWVFVGVYPEGPFCPFTGVNPAVNAVYGSHIVYPTALCCVTVRRATTWSTVRARVPQARVLPPGRWLVLHRVVLLAVLRSPVRRPIRLPLRRTRCSSVPNVDAVTRAVTFLVARISLAVRSARRGPARPNGPKAEPAMP